MVHEQRGDWLARVLHQEYDPAEPGLAAFERRRHRRMPHGITEKLLLVTPEGIAPRD